MRGKLTVLGALTAILIAGPDPARGQAQMGTAFTYQGRVEDDGGPITDNCDFEFSLWDAEVAGLEVGSSPQSANGVSVEDGLFTVAIDFGAGAMNGEARWLELAVCCPSPCAVETLDPRQELTPAPQAIRALEGVGPPEAVNLDASGNVGIGTAAPARALHIQGSNGTIRVDRDTNSPGIMFVRTASGDFDTVWKTFGISVIGDAPGSGKLAINDKGTAVSGSGVRRLTIDTDGNVGIGTETPSELLDVAGNIHASGAVSSGSSITIDGTGDTITASSGTISFDDEDLITAGVIESTVGGFILPDGTIIDDAGDLGSSGAGNTLDAAYDQGGAGAGRTIIADAGAVEILGPDGLSVAGSIQSGSSITLDGTPGAEKITSTDALELHTSTGRILRLEPEVDAISGLGNSPNILAGWSGNTITPGVAGATIAGGGTDDDGMGTPVPNRVTDEFGTVGGGYDNQAGDNAGTTYDARNATVGGGQDNTASSTWATVAGGNYNRAGGVSATIGGGFSNTVTQGGTVGGGSLNEALGLRATIGGGSGNTASGESSTIGGGHENTASGRSSTVGGGGIPPDGGNTASGDNSTIGGGQSNEATAGWATVGGGFDNTASGGHSTVPGGWLNVAGGYYSLAAGRRAMVRDAAASGDADGDEGTFVWADSTDADFTSTGPNQFLIRASGNVGIGTNTPSEQLDVAGNIAVSGTVDGVDISALTSLPPSGPAGGALGGTYPNPSVNDDSHSHTDGTISDNISINNGRLYAPTGSGDVGIGDATPDGKLEVRQTAAADILNLYDGTTNVLTVQDGGDVGIGTPTPSQKLDVAGNIAVSGTVDGVDIASHAADANAHHTPPTTLPPSGAAGGDLSGTYPNPSVNDDSHWHNDGTISDNVSINNGLLYAPSGSGSVGIGDNTPDAKLEVRQTAAADILNLYDNTTNVLTVLDGGDVGIGTTSPSAKLDVAGSFEAASLQVDGSTLFVDAANNEVGIGTTNPSAKLDVVGSLEVDGSTLFVDAANNEVGIGVATPDGKLEVRQASAADIFNLYDGGTNVFTVQDGGDVGINTGNPAGFELAVAGNAAKVGGGSWALYSDERLKKDIEPLTGVLERLLRLEGVSYELKDPAFKLGLPGRQIGLIAQRVEEVFPDWVGEDTDGYKYMAIRGFEALTVEALRELREEQDERIETLRREIETLRSEKDAQIAELEARLTALELLFKHADANGKGGVR